MRVQWNPIGDITAKIEVDMMERLTRAAEMVRDKAQQLVPVGEDVPQGKGKWSKRESGALKRTIRVVRLKGDPKLDVRVYAGNRKGGIFYAHFVEYGTSKMPAKPFLRPALQQVRNSLLNILKGEGK